MTLALRVPLPEMTGEPDAASLQLLNEMPGAVPLVVQPAGERQTGPSGFQLAIPGIMVMFTLLIMTNWRTPAETAVAIRFRVRSTFRARYSCSSVRDRLTAWVFAAR